MIDPLAVPVLAEDLLTEHNLTLETKQKRPLVLSDEKALVISERDQWSGGLTNYQVVRVGHGHLGQDRVDERLRQVTRILDEIIDMDSEKRQGIPVLRGSRFPVAQILAELAEDQRLSEIAADYRVSIRQLRRLLRGMALFLDRPGTK